jgi:hypothetical protein
VSGEKHPYASAAGGVEDGNDRCGDLWRVGDLADDPDLHVVDDQCQVARVTNILECERYV